MQENDELAFPTTGKEYINNSDEFPTTGMFGGMTLRDYFAAKALQGMLSDSDLTGSWDEFAEGAYKYADAMLKRRVTQS